MKLAIDFSPKLLSRSPVGACLGTLPCLGLCIYKPSMHLAFNQTHLQFITPYLAPFTVHLVSLFPPIKHYPPPFAAHLHYCNLSLPLFHFSFNFIISLCISVASSFETWISSFPSYFLDQNHKKSIPSM